MEVNDAFLKQYSKCLPDSKPTLCVIGGGKMARALIQGFVNAGFFCKDNVSVCAKSQSTVEQWTDEGYNSFKSTKFYTFVKPTGIILICVKPQIFFGEACDELEKWFQKNGHLNCVLISVMAGVSTQSIRDRLRVNAIRFMPSITCTTGEGSLIVTKAQDDNTENVKLILFMGSKLGYCTEVSENLFDAAAVLSGSGPAFIFMLMEALADGGVLCGLSRELSLKLAANTVKGAAQLFLNTNKSLGQLKDEICSPSGTTIAGVRELEKSGVRSAFIEAVFASKRRAVELSLD